MNLSIIKESKVLRDKWKNYSRKNNYARNIELDEIIKSLGDFIEILIPVLSA